MSKHRTIVAALLALLVLSLWTLRHASAITDDEPPTISEVRFKPENPTSSDEVTVYAIVEDNGTGVKDVALYYKVTTYYIKVEMLLLENCTYAGTIPPQEEGATVKFFVVAWDFANNTSISQVYSYTVSDTTPPYISGVVQRPDKPSYEDRVFIYALVVENVSGLRTVFLYYKIDGGPWLRIPMSEIGGSWFCGDIPPQPYNTTVYYYVEAVDKAGNVAASEIRNYTVVDEKPPTLEGVSYPEEVRVGEELTVSANARDAGAGIKSVVLRWKFEEEEDWRTLVAIKVGEEWVFYFPKLEKTGTLVFYVVVEDAAGNVVESPKYTIFVAGSNPSLPGWAIAGLLAFAMGGSLAAAYKTGRLGDEHRRYLAKLEKMEKKIAADIVQELEKAGFDVSLDDLAAKRG